VRRNQAAQSEAPVLYGFQAEFKQEPGCILAFRALLVSRIPSGVLSHKEGEVAPISLSVDFSDIACFEAGIVESATRQATADFSDLR